MNNDSLSEQLNVLVGAPLHDLNVVPRRNANNALYRLKSTSGIFAAKVFHGIKPKDVARFERECAALRFFNTHKIEHVVQAHAIDTQNKIIIYPWIDGPRPNADATFVDAAWKLAETLYSKGKHSEPTALSDATEACLCLDELCHQIRTRLQRLRQRDIPASAELSGLLNMIDEKLSVAETKAARWFVDTSVPLPQQHRMPSPSDFGAHNALVSPSGPVFIDFEYFGWDDPVKLTADFMWHPGMSLDQTLRARSHAHAVRIFAEDGSFTERLRMLYPLYGLRWAVIILNPFVPDRWQRMIDAGESRYHDDVLGKQLEHAAAYVATATP